MRSASVIPLVLLAAAATAGCRPPKGAPATAAAANSVPDEPALPSGVATRSVFTLANGVRVILEENHAAPVVAMQVWLAVGAADDPEGQEGAANVVRHLLRRSLQAPGAGPVIGARSGAWTSYDETVVHALVATPFVDDGLRALAGAITTPSMTSADFEAARAAARADLRATRADPPHVAAASALASAFSANPYRRPLLGSDATLGDLTGERVRAFFDRAYGARQATLVVVGDFDARAVRERVDDLFTGWRQAVAPAVRAHEPPQSDPHVTVATADVADPELALAWRTPDFRDADRAALQVLAAVLGQGARTRLDDELVRNRQLARETRAFLFAARDGGLLVTSATLGGGAVEDAAAVLLEEVARLGRDGPTRDELARARTLVERQEVAQKASVDGYARRLGLYATVGGDPDLEAAHLRRVREVDGKQVQQAAARFLRTANLTVAVTLPVVHGAAARADERAPRLLARLRATVAAAGTRAPIVAAKAARGADVRNIETYRLPSGVRLLILPDDTADQVSVRAVWPGGARIEDGHLTGAASLIARLLVRGTKTRAPEQLAAELADAGGRLEGFAAQDVLGLRGEFLASHWEHGLDLSIDCLRNPRFAEEDVEQDRRVVLDAIRVRDNDPASVVRRLFEDTLYDGRPYHEDALGTSESVAALTRRRLLDFFRAAYGPSTLTLAIVGAVDPARVADRVQALFADAPLAAREPAAPAGSSAVAAPQGKGGAAPPGEPRQVVRFGPAGQARLVLGFPGVTPGDPDRLALDVIAEILNQPGRRLAALRDGRGLLEQVEAKSTVSADGGTFAIGAAVRPDLLELAVAAIRGELARLLDAGVTADELAAARQSLVARRALSFQRRGAVALSLALGATLGDPARSPRRDLDDLGRLKVDDVLRAARRLLDPRREVLAVVRPQQNRVSLDAPAPRPRAARGRTLRARSI